MRKLLLSIVILLCASICAKAIPADPRPITITQSDGSVVTVLMHGDESFHWMTTLDGTQVEWNSNGKLVKVSASKIQALSASQSARQIKRAPEPSKNLTHGTKKFLVLLIEFSDKHFVKQNQDFNNLLQQNNYLGTGCVAEYYRFQSSNAFNPSWDVIGPIRVSGPMAAYGGNNSLGNDINPDGLLAEACALIDNEVDFSQYDNDGDGIVENVFYFFAGYAESSGGGDDTIWPHSWGLHNTEKYNNIFDGVKVVSYACASELEGSSMANMAGIGTFCHEFGHVLGLPDFYDVDYEKNGQAEYTPKAFSLMDYGNYNNNSATPPNFGAVERLMLGWMEDPTEITATGNYTLGPIYNNHAYISNTSIEGEFFLYELRDGQNYDKYIEYNGKAVNGIVVYHIDMSQNLVSGSTTAASLWEGTNSINIYGSHPCHRIIPSRKGGKDFHNWVFPGKGNYTSFLPIEWSGFGTNTFLENIDVNGSTASFHATISNGRAVRGKVSDSMGNAISGASITISGQDLSAITGGDGSYRIDLTESTPNNLTITASANGYISSFQNISVGAGIQVVDFTLYTVEQGGPDILKKYTIVNDTYYTLGYGDPVNYPEIALAVSYSAEELTDFVGSTLKNIDFKLNGNSVEEAKIFVDFGSERVLEKVVTPSFYPNPNTIDISEYNLVIPSGVDILFGYALKNADDPYPALSDGSEDYIPGAGCFCYTYEAKHSDFSEMNSHVAISAQVTRQPITPIELAGIKVIYYDDATSSYKLTNAGPTPSAVSWTVEGNKVTALVEYLNGDIEIIEREF